MKEVNLKLIGGQEQSSIMSDNNAYGPILNFATPIKKKGNSINVYQVSPGTCRDYLLNRLFIKTSGRVGGNHGYAVEKISNTAMRMTVAFSDGPAAKRDELVEGVMRVLNIIEAKAGFNRTSVYRVLPPRKVKSRAMYMFRGSKNWLRSSHMSSLYILLLRIGLKGEWDSIKTYKDFLAFARKGSDSGDRGYLRTHIESIRVMVENFSMLYKDFPFKRNWTVALFNDSTKDSIRNIRAKYTKGSTELDVALLGQYSSEGLMKLSNGTSNDTSLVGRLNNLRSLLSK